MAETKKDSKDTQVESENEVEIEFDYPELPLLKNLKTGAQFREELQAKFDAEKPQRDALKAKREKALEELISLGLSEESAKFLTNIE